MRSILSGLFSPKMNGVIWEAIRILTSKRTARDFSFVFPFP